jgi:predicted HD phosphohydrolase
MATTEEKINNIFKLYNDYGSVEYMGQGITHLEHALQTAYFARAQGYDNVVVTAALLHGIGHLIGLKYDFEIMGNFGIKNYEKIGADWLRQVEMSETTCLLIEKHTQARRFIVTTSPDYYDNLSETSKEILKLKGDLMAEKEIEEFRSNELKQALIVLSIWDEKSKMKNKSVPSLENYRKTIRLSFRINLK